MTEQAACRLEPGNLISIHCVQFADLAERAGCTILELHNSETALLKAVQAYSGCDDCSLKDKTCPGGEIQVIDRYQRLSFRFTRPYRRSTGGTAEKGGLENNLGCDVMRDALRNRAVITTNCGLEPGGTREVKSQQIRELAGWEGAKEVAGCWNCQLLYNGCEGAVADMKDPTELTARITSALIGRPFADGRSPFGNTIIAETVQYDEVDVPVVPSRNDINLDALQGVKRKLDDMEWWERKKFKQEENKGIQKRYGDQRHKSKPHGNKGQRSKGGR